ncbi:universal stress protein [Novosphingobium sp. CECT 9465]|uniref:universal stress protein n=1 Tax=unclassified Novosphingobium TaxID=2644732 RepID=UPI001E439C75|nr:universal stress protein [Novosphingobium sp. CECT 9465]CAH0498727.1 hypothetical protein NVSP9465_03821 [Novosphingobium sp. CECT 9465]
MNETAAHKNVAPVLVGTDLSARSDRAVDRAMMLANSLQERLIVLHALDADNVLTSDQTRIEREIRNALAKPDADVDILPAIGPAPSTICSAAQSTGCRLIVTGVARMNHIGDYFIGTAVDHVIRNAAMPVLVVKQRPHHAYRSILVATDCSPCSREALLTAAALFPDARLHVVHAFHVPYEAWLRSDETRDEVTEAAHVCLTEFLADPAIADTLRKRVELHLDYGEVDQVICAAAETLDADLIVLGTHGRNGFVRAMIGSRAEELLRCVSVDTLLVREDC